MEVHQISYKARPFKVALKDRKFKGIVAVNLKDLKLKSQKSLGLDSQLENINVLLSEDDTWIDDEEYFATLPDNTKLIIQDLNSEKEIDVVDAANEQSESQEIMMSSTNKHLSDVLRSKLTSSNMVDCITSFLTMSNEELESLLSCDADTLSLELDCDKDVCEVYIDNANKELLRRQELTEAKQLLTMFERAKKFDATDGVKRKKSSRKF